MRARYVFVRSCNLIYVCSDLDGSRHPLPGRSDAFVHVVCSLQTTTSFRGVTGVNPSSSLALLLEIGHKRDALRRASGRFPLRHIRDPELRCQIKEILIKEGT
jgi:hypothetical protein